MTSIPQIPPGTPSPAAQGEDLRAQVTQAAAKLGGTFNHVINVLNGISGNEAWFLKLFKEWLGDLKQFSGLINSLSSAIQDITSKNPVDAGQDAKTIIKDLRELAKMPEQLKGELTKMMEAKYGTPLPPKAKKFIDEATAKIQQLVTIVRNKLVNLENDAPPPVDRFAVLMARAFDGLPVTPKDLEAAAAKAAAAMHTKDGKLTPAWYAINGFEGTLTQANEGAEFLNATVSAREQQIASEIQAVFTGISKTVDKQFKAIMMMIRGILSR